MIKFRVKGGVLVVAHTKNARNELTRLAMGTIFLVKTVTLHCRESILHSTSRILHLNMLCPKLPSKQYIYFTNN